MTASTDVLPDGSYNAAQIALMRPTLSLACGKFPLLGLSWVPYGMNSSNVGYSGSVGVAHIGKNSRGGWYWSVHSVPACGNEHTAIAAKSAAVAVWTEWCASAGLIRQPSMQVDAIDIAGPVLAEPLPATLDHEPLLAVGVFVT